MLQYAWGICNQANPATSLLAQLQAQLNLALPAVKGGTIKTTSANGQRTTFGQQGEDLTTRDVVEVWSFLQDLFNEAKVQIWFCQWLQANPNAQVLFSETFDFQYNPQFWIWVHTTNPPVPPDTQLEPLMERMLRPITGYTNNFMYLAK